jgi:hypothetical protein
VDLQQADRETASRKRVDDLIVQFAKIRATAESAEKPLPATLPAQLGALQRRMSPLYVVYPVLLKRSYLNFRRSPNLVLTRLMQVSSFGIILALFYSRLGNDYVAVQNRVGYIQEITPLVFVGMLVRLAYFAEVDGRIISPFTPTRGMLFIANTMIALIDWSPSFYRISRLNFHSNWS